MKVLMVVPEYPPYNIGGGGIVYKNLVDNLLNNDIDVSVVWGYYKTDSIFTRTLVYKHNGINFYRIPEVPYPKSKPYLRTAMPPNLYGLYSIYKIVKRENPDIAHMHGYGIPLVDIASFLCKQIKIPYVLTIHGYPKTPEKIKFFNIFWTFYENFIVRQTLYNAKAITCISKWIAEDKKLKLYKHKTKVIYNGINIDEFNIIYNSDNNIRHILNLPEESIILCSIGRISEMKGFQLVIKILPELIKKYSPNIYYVIIGEDDGYKNDLIKIAKKLKVYDHIIFTGFLSGQTKLKFIKECDVFIVPSIYEPFGLTALEGLAMKKIVVTTGAGGLKEFLSKCRNVIFFNKNDENSLIIAISNIIDGKVKYNYEPCLKRFDWKFIVKEYIKVYESVL